MAKARLRTDGDEFTTITGNPYDPVKRRQASRRTEGPERCGGEGSVQPGIMACRRYFAVGRQHVAWPPDSSAVAKRHAEKRRGVDRVPVLQHFEIDMHAVRYAAMAHHADLLAGRQDTLAVGDCRRDHAEVAVDTDEAIMLHQ